MFRGTFSAWHWLVLAVVFLILFGAAKLPVFAKSLGESLRIFKAETRTTRDGAPDAQALPAPDVQAVTGPAVDAGSATVVDRRADTVPAER